MLVIVTVFGALVTPTATLPKAKLTGEKVRGAIPVPVRLATCGDFVVLATTVIAPETLPVTVGVNVAVIVQLPPPASVPPQVVVLAKSPLAVMDESVAVPPPVFFSVITLPALVEPTAVEVNVSLVGVKVKVADEDVPVPFSVTLWGEFDALSVIEIAPVRLPAESGENVTVIVQLAGEGPSVVGQLLVCAKFPVAAPIVSGVDPVPVFLTVTVLDGLVVPTAWEANVNVAGVTVITTVAAFPVPVRLTVWGELDALSVIEIEPVRVPVAVGVNVTVIVQLAGEGPSVVGQLLVCAKSPVAGAIVSGVEAVPVFFTVTVLPALVVPTVCEAKVSLVGVVVTTTVPAA